MNEPTDMKGSPPNGPADLATDWSLAELLASMPETDRLAALVANADTSERNERLFRQLATVMLTDTSQTVRLAAGRFLMPLVVDAVTSAGDTTIPLLRKGLFHADSSVVSRTAQLISIVGSTAPFFIDDIITALTSRLDDAALFLIIALRECLAPPYDRQALLLAKLTTNPQPLVRSVALQMLGSVTGPVLPDVAEALEVSLRDSVVANRFDALSSMDRLDLAGPSHLPLAEELVKCDTLSEDNRLRVQNIIGRIVLTRATSAHS